MLRLSTQWQQQRQALLQQSMRVLAESLGQMAAAREPLEGDSGWTERVRRLGDAIGRRSDNGPAAQAQRRLARKLDAEVRSSTEKLLQLHGLQGSAQPEILARVASQFTGHAPVSEGKAAVWGGAVTGALAGLKADVVSGGLTLGGGMLAGAVLGALGAAGVARGINIVRGGGQAQVAWSDAALNGAVEAALLRYLAVAHFGRGRGNWSPGEAPAHWRSVAAEVVQAHLDALDGVWATRRQRHAFKFRGERPEGGEGVGSAGVVPGGVHGPVALCIPDLQAVLQSAVLDMLRRLYPDAESLRPTMAP